MKLISHPGPKAADPPGKRVRQHLPKNKHYLLKEYVIFILIYLHPFFPESTSGAGYLPDVFISLVSQHHALNIPRNCSSYQHGEDQNIMVPPNPDTRGSRTPPGDQLYNTQLDQHKESKHHPTDNLILFRESSASVGWCLLSLCWSNCVLYS